MKQTTLTVHLETEPDQIVEETVDARLCDQVRAELEVRKRYQLAPTEAGITFTAAMAWAALAREGRTEMRFDQFLTAAHDITRAADPADVDPTRPAVSNDSASPSPAPSPEPGTTGGSPA